MIKIEFDEYNSDVARIFGEALTKLAALAEGPPVPEESTGRDATEWTPTESLLEPGDEVTMSDGTDAVVVATTQSIFDKTDTASADLDDHGVAFDDEYCGKATDPFYGSGKHTGQWKKKRGVSEATYDKWYAGQLEQGAAQTALNTATTPENHDERVDTGPAFGTVPAETPKETPEPQDAGAFMVWVSELQAAGRLTQQDLGEAYAGTNLTVTDLFGADAVAVSANVKALYAILSARAAA